jgi:hypothetical protein
MNGNSRLFVREERGLNINDLGLRPQIYNSPSLTPWEDEMLPHNPTEKPPDIE